MITLADKGGRGDMANADIGCQRGDGGLATNDITGQKFCDLHTLLHKFFGFSGAFCNATILVFGWKAGLL